MSNPLFEMNKNDFVNVLALPSGATKIAGIAGAAVTIITEGGYEPDVITGVSAGAILAVPLALGMYQTVLEESANLTLRKMFKIPPTTKKGKINPIAALRALLGYQSLGVQDLSKIIARIVPPEKYKEYQLGNFPTVYVVAADYFSKEPVVFNLKDESNTYSDFIKRVEASARVPIATQPQKIGGRLYVDGGLVDLNSGVRICRQLEKAGQRIGRLWSIYPRPEDGDLPPQPEPKNIFDVALGAFDITLKEIGRNDQENEKYYRREKSSKVQPFELKQFFMPWILESLYDVDPQKLKYLQDQSIKETRKQLGLIY